MKSTLCSCTRSRIIEFLIKAARELEVSPVVKYSALSLFADRFYPLISRLEEKKHSEHWLLGLKTESNMQLFALISIWISSKIHDSPPLSVKKLKSIADKYIKEQHYTTRDFLEGVLEFGIGMSNTTFVYLEELLNQFKGVACVAEYVSIEVCMDLMDLLYEKEEISLLYNSPRSLAASILVACYVIAVPIQKWEFPVLPWVKFVFSCKEEEIMEIVRNILKHVFESQTLEET